MLKQLKWLLWAVEPLYFGGPDIPKETTTTTKVTLSPEQQRLLNMAMPFATSYGSNPPSIAPISGVAGFSPLEQFANQTRMLGAQRGSRFADSAVGAHQFALGDVLDIRSNPYLQAATNAAIDPLIKNYERRVLPNIRAGAQQAGQYGGSRQGIAEGIAASDLNRQIGSISANMASQGYQTGLDAFTKALALAPQTQNMFQYGANQLDTIAGRERSIRQGILDESIRNWMMQQNLPIDVASRIAGLAFGMPTGQSVTSPTNITGPNFGQSLLGAASTGLGAYGIMSGAEGALATAAPWAAGGLALLSLLSN
jgi:hypothetical protein